ncbi:hypothetical protein B0T25DRAFT_545516 [Lasiosphaeria hispida]|uniref:Uncharacterized protein n=1 Tax=Lasiosphaeria hispida TaxID=260671 RepID=A0AAJ0MEW2_9PEZI|nr:hypothetical protein B0T25DRAFT_545516 [Lasiosphaeria hispida]
MFGDNAKRYPGAATTTSLQPILGGNLEARAVIWCPHILHASSTSGNIDADMGILDMAYNRLSVSHGNDIAESSTSFRPRAGPFLSRRTRNWPRFEVSMIFPMFSFWLLSSLYGSLHCLAWNAHFPSRSEGILWQVSSITLLVGGFPILICFFMYKMCQWHKYHDIPPAQEIGDDGVITDVGGQGIQLTWAVRRWRILVSKVLRRMPGALIHKGMADRLLLNNGKGVPRFIDRILPGMAVSFAAFVLIARTYLVVECFIQLAHLPPGPVFTLPVWSVYFPHIG